MFEDRKDSFSKDVSSGGSVAAALPKLKWPQNLSVVASKLQELNKVLFQNQVIVNHLDAKIVELSQRAISPDDLRGLQHGIESNMAVISNDQTCAITGPITHSSTAW